MKGTQGAPALSQGPGRAHERLALWVMVLVLLLAFGLRAYHLDFQSFWTDEGRSGLRAAVPLAELDSQVPVDHLPTYFGMLHIWALAAGPSDFALRYFSLWPSVLAIALAYRLARDLGSTRAGLIGALLMATGAFQVWYGQEARMYSWMLATGLVSTLCLWRLLRPRARGRRGQSPLPAGLPRDTRLSGKYIGYFAGYVLATAASVYMHYYGLALPVAQTVFMVSWLALTRDWRGFARWVAAGACVVLLYLPALWRLASTYGRVGQVHFDAGPVSQIPLRFFMAYTAGDPMPKPWHTWLPAIYLLMLVAGASLWWRTNRLGALLLLTSVIVPVTIAWVIALKLPQVHERYTISSTAPLLLLAANGFGILASLARRGHPAPSPGAQPRLPSKATRPVMLSVAGLMLVGAVVTNCVALDRLYFDTLLHKADYRSAAVLIQQSEAPGDVIVADTNFLEDTFERYYHGTSPVAKIHFTGQADSQPQSSAAMQLLTAGARRVWGLDHNGGNGYLQSWLGQNGWHAWDFDHNGLHLALYGMSTLPASKLPAHDVLFGHDLLLRQAELVGAGDATPAGTVHAGDFLGVTTHWQVRGRLPSLKFSLRLVDPSGAVRAAEEYVPQGGYAPTKSWQPGVAAVDRRGTLLPADLPPATYTLSLRLYQAETGEALPAGTGPDLTLGQVSVLPAVVPLKPAALPIPVRLSARLGPDLQIQGFGTDPDPLHVEQGGAARIWWQALRSPAQAYQVQIELLNGAGQAISRFLGPLSIAPTNGWQTGQVVREVYPLALDPAAASGSYHLRLSLAGPDGRLLGPSLVAGRVAVQARPRRYDLPRMQHPLGVRLEQGVALRGYDLLPPPAAGGDLRLTLYWQAGQRVNGSYKVFVHLLDDAGQIRAQSDSVPAGGAAPTPSWLPGEVIADSHTLPVPAPGRYRLIAGLYDEKGGQRMTAGDANGQLYPNAAIPLGEIHIP